MSLERVGETIREWRGIRGLSQESLAARAGMNPDTVWRIETGRRRPRPSTLQKLARALGVQVEELTQPRREEQPVGFARNETWNLAHEDFGGVRVQAGRDPLGTPARTKGDLRRALLWHLAQRDNPDAVWMVRQCERAYVTALEAVSKTTPGDAAAEVGAVYREAITQHVERTTE